MKILHGAMYFEIGKKKKDKANPVTGREGP
jgi:hypothetical protein